MASELIEAATAPTVRRSRLHATMPHCPQPHATRRRQRAGVQTAAAARGRLTASPPCDAAPWLRLWLGPELDPSARPRVRFQIAHDAMIRWLMALGWWWCAAALLLPSPKSQIPSPYGIGTHDGIKLPAFPSHASFYLASRVSRPHRSPRRPGLLHPFASPPPGFSAPVLISASHFSLPCYEKRKLSPSLKF